MKKDNLQIDPKITRMLREQDVAIYLLRGIKEIPIAPGPVFYKEKEGTRKLEYHVIPRSGIIETEENEAEKSADVFEDKYGFATSALY